MLELYSSSSITRDALLLLCLFIGLEMITLKEINVYIKKLEANIEVANIGNPRVIEYLLETKREFWF